MKRNSEAAYLSALRRKTKRKTETLLAAPLSAMEVLKRCGADRDRMCKPRTFADALTELEDMVPFWLIYEEDHPNLAELVLSTARMVVAGLKAGKYPGVPSVPTDWIGFLDWIPQAKLAARRQGGGKGRPDVKGATRIALENHPQYEHHPKKLEPYVLKELEVQWPGYKPGPYFGDQVRTCAREIRKKRQKK